MFVGSSLKASPNLNSVAPSWESGMSSRTAAKAACPICCSAVSEWSPEPESFIARIWNV